MDRADVAALASSLREAFLAGGKDMRERKSVTGQAFLLGGHAVGQIDVRANVVRSRLWLPEKERRRFESRPTFDPESGWLHIVSADDVAFLRELLPVACRAATSGSDAAPPAPRGVEIAPPRRIPVAATGAVAKTRPAVGTKGGAEPMSGTNKGAASAAPPSRPRRTRD
jgi:hypothetical protein